MNKVDPSAPKKYPATSKLMWPGMLKEVRAFTLCQDYSPSKLWYASILPAWIAMMEPLSPSSKLVFPVICSYYSRHRKAHPAHETLAAKTGLGKSTVKAAINELRDYGLLAVYPKGGISRNGKRPTNAYAPQWGTLCRLATLVHRRLVPVDVLRFHEVALAKKDLQKARRSAGDMCQKIADYVYYEWLSDRRRKYPFDFSKIDPKMSQILAIRKI